MNNYTEKARRTGSAQFLIDELCESVKDGQPKSIVWAHNREYIPSLRHRVAEKLQSLDLTVDIVAQDRVECEGSEILFMAKQKTHGIHGYGDFVDHHALNDNWFRKKFMENQDFTI